MESENNEKWDYSYSRDGKQKARTSFITNYCNIHLSSLYFWIYNQISISYWISTHNMLYYLSFLMMLQTCLSLTVFLLPTSCITSFILNNNNQQIVVTHDHARITTSLQSSQNNDSAIHDESSMIDKQPLDPNISSQFKILTCSSTSW